MVESNMNGDEPRLVLTGGAGARVVLAEADAPGSLHYLLEAEGFQVVGCASDEDELGRVLGQDVRPDVIVLDADVVATSSLVARRLAPEAHVIAVWPDAVQPPPGGERVDPRMVYEELGPAIRRHMDRRTVPVPVIAMPAEEPVMAGAVATAAVPTAAVPTASGSVVARVASRVSVLSATLITAILLTMGVSFALGGFRWHPSDGPSRVFVPRSSDAGPVDTSDPLNGRVPSGVGNGDPGSKPTDHSGGSNDHHGSGGISAVVATTTGGGGDGGSTPGDQTGGSGDQTGGSGDQGGGQGDQGGGQGDQGGGGGQGDQGGGGGQGDHGGQGGGQGGGGQGDQGGDGQHGGGDGQGDQDGDSQGEDEQGDGQGDQGGDSQGEDSQGGHGSHGEGHGAHSDDQNSDNQ